MNLNFAVFELFYVDLRKRNSVGTLFSNVDEALAFSCFSLLNDSGPVGLLLVGTERAVTSMTNVAIDDPVQRWIHS